MSELKMEAINKARHFASKDELRPVLNSIFIDDKGTLWATDSYKLVAVRNAASGIIDPLCIKQVFDKKQKGDARISEEGEKYSVIYADNKTTVSDKVLGFPAVKSLVKSDDVDDRAFISLDPKLLKSICQSAIDGGDKVITLSVSQKKHAPLYIQMGEDTFAMAMPIRDDKGDAEHLINLMDSIK